MVEVCEPDDKLSLIYQCNKETSIKVNTPFGQSESATVEDTEAQGNVLSPIRCAVQIDSIGKECLENNENIFKYKKLLNIPPLSMIDDVVGIAECGHKSIKLNCYINTKIEMKKLWMGEDKCHQIHCGESSSVCPDLVVHDSVMKRVLYDTYLGFIVSNDSLNRKNIEFRCGKGMGYISQIMLILEEIVFGQFYFETAVLLRESIFVNGLLSNIEVSYALTMEEIDKLEILDNILLRKFLSAHSKVATEILFYDLGVYPLRFYIVSKRVNFLHYVLNRPESDLTKQFLLTQEAHPVKNDWTITVKKDLEFLGMSSKFNVIKTIKKETFSKSVKERILACALDHLNLLKSKHSKSTNLQYNGLQLQSYLKSSAISKNEAQSIFAYRTRTKMVKENFRSQFTNDLTCPESDCDSTDNQRHLLDHSDINGCVNYDKMFTEEDCKDKQYLLVSR